MISVAIVLAASLIASSTIISDVRDGLRDCIVKWMLLYFLFMSRRPSNSMRLAQHSIRQFLRIHKRLNATLHKLFQLIRHSIANWGCKEELRESTTCATRTAPSSKNLLWQQQRLSLRDLCTGL
eukprot:5614209-Amphidinium_carterae.1